MGTWPFNLYPINDYLPGYRVGPASQIGSKIDFKGDPIFESAAWFFVIILKYIFTSIFETKIHVKNSLRPKNFIFEGQFLITVIS